MIKGTKLTIRLSFLFFMLISLNQSATGMDQSSHIVQKSWNNFVDSREKYLEKINNETVRKEKKATLKKYMNSVKKTCDEAMIYFNTIKQKKINSKTAVAFDIDDTAFVNCIPTDKWFPEAHLHYHIANPYILELYRYLVDRGITIFFISARVDSTTATRTNLKKEGFTVYEDVICMTEKEYEQADKSGKKFKIKKAKEEHKHAEKSDEFFEAVAQWKEHTRAHLSDAEYYNFIATFDDQEQNLYTSSEKEKPSEKRAFTGKVFHLPRRPNLSKD